MPNRLDIELTSIRGDGSYTWRAAGARQPKGVIDAKVLAEDAKVGDVLRVEAEVEIDGITILSVLPPKEKATPGGRIELIGSSKPIQAVTTVLLSEGGRGGDRRDLLDSPRRGDRSSRDRRPSRGGERPDARRPQPGGGEATAERRPRPDSRGRELRTGEGQPTGFGGERRPRPLEHREVALLALLKAVLQDPVVSADPVPKQCPWWSSPQRRWPSGDFRSRAAPFTPGTTRRPGAPVGEQSTAGATLTLGSATERSP